MDYLTLGTIVGSFGLDGSLKVFSSTHFGKERYKKGNKIILLNLNESKEIPLTVVSYRNNAPFDIIKFEEICTKEEADSLKNNSLVIAKDQSILPNNTYFYSDLEKCDVYDESNTKIGFVKRVEEFPAQITLRVGRSGKQDFFIPFINEFIKKVDINDKKITVHVIEGML